MTQLAHYSNTADIPGEMRQGNRETGVVITWHFDVKLLNCHTLGQRSVMKNG